MSDPDYDDGAYHGRVPRDSKANWIWDDSSEAEFGQHYMPVCRKCGLGPLTGERVKTGLCDTTCTRPPMKEPGYEKEIGLYVTKYPRAPIYQSIYPQVKVVPFSDGAFVRVPDNFDETLDEFENNPYAMTDLPHEIFIPLSGARRRGCRWVLFSRSVVEPPTKEEDTPF